MADPGPPSIAVESASDIPRDGTLQREVKKSLESLLSRSDSGASGDEVDEPEQTLSVPSTVQGKPRETSRKGRKISVNEALKVSIGLYIVCGNVVYTGNIAKVFS